VSANGGETRVQFEHGTSTSYGLTTSKPDAARQSARAQTGRGRVRLSGTVSPRLRGRR